MMQSLERKFFMCPKCIAVIEHDTDEATGQLVERSIHNGDPRCDHKLKAIHYDYFQYLLEPSLGNFLKCVWTDIRGYTHNLVGEL